MPQLPNDLIDRRTRRSHACDELERRAKAAHARVDAEPGAPDGGFARIGRERQHPLRRSAGKNETVSGLFKDGEVERRRELSERQRRLNGLALRLTALRHGLSSECVWQDR